MTRAWEQAVRQRDLEGLARLIRGGADVDSKDRHGQTGLMVAAKYGHREVALLLVAQGAELNHTAKYHLSALMLAVINGHADIVRMLVDAGADPDIRGTGAPGFHGKSARDLAEGRNQPDLLEALGDS